MIRVRNGCFHEDGSPFKIVGANNYYLAFATPAMRRAVIDVAKGIGLNVLRTPAYLDCASPGEGAWRGVCFQYWNRETNCPEVNTGENGLQRLDHLIADAEQAGMRLILPLVNYWPDFGGMDRYVAWFKADSRDEFYLHPKIREAYQSYVEQILTRTNTITGRSYNDEPAVLAWELANEPRCEIRGGEQILLGWVHEMSAWVKQHDPNHLLAVGDEGYFGRHGVDCEALLRVPDIDFGTFHLYPEIWKKRNAVRAGVRWIEEHLALGKRVGKPMVLEEYGMTVDRDAIYRAWLETILRQDGAGSLAWMLASTDDETGQPYQDYDHYTFYGGEEIPAIRDHALQMNGCKMRDDDVQT